MPYYKRADTRNVPLPVVLSPSGSFDGDDGSWSTFNINVAGDGEGKGQDFKVLMSTSSPITIVPGQTGWCNTDECAKSRGILTPNSLGLDDTTSNEYRSAGLYTLPFASLYYWSPNLLLPGNGSSDGIFGISNVGLGPASQKGNTVTRQFVAKHLLKDFFLGSLGLSIGTTDAANAQLSTYLSRLDVTKTVIPSLSYGFTAGASYRNGGRGVTGNMVFGGYDKTRLLTQQMATVQMPSKQNNTLLVGVQSILYTPDQDVQKGSESFTNTTNGGFFAVIDSTLPYLVLPGYICDRFVQSFNLGYDKSTGLYTINGTAHERNQVQNATVSFAIGSDTKNSANSTTITLPYQAFYLEASYPIYSNVTHYFPIRKSSNGYNILGRTFLQEAYIVVDYERFIFSVAPAAFPSPTPIESLVTIHNVSYVTPTSSPEPGKVGIATGAIVGIVIGIVAIFALFGVGAFFFFRRRRDTRAKKSGQEEKPPGVDTVEAGGEVKHRRISELTGSEPPYSPLNKPTTYYGSEHKSIAELSPESHPVELYNPENDVQADYFAGTAKPRRRGATRNSTGPNTPGTPIAELPGDNGRYQSACNQSEAVSPMMRPQHSRGPSDNSLTTNIDEVLAGPDRDNQHVQRKHSSKFVEHTNEEDGPSRADLVVSPLENTREDERGTATDPTTDHRPHHTRGLSDATVASDSTAVSQPTPDEIESWARSVDDRPKRRMSR